MLYMRTRFQVLWMKKCTNLCQISKFQSGFPCSNMDLNEMFYISEAVPPNNKDILAWECQSLNFMREGERGKRGGVSVSWTHFKVIVLDMSFREHPSNHINKRLDALGGWKEIWISHWCIILTHFLTWVWDGEGFTEHNKRIGDLFSNKHSGMDGLRWIPSYSQINLHTHTKTDGRGLKVMDAMYKLELLQARG